MKKTLTVLILTVVILLGLGIVLVATASNVRAQSLYKSPYAFFYKQLIWLGVATVVGFVASRFDYHLWKKYPVLPILFYLAIVCALALVVCPGVRKLVNGSYRWLTLGPISVQPSEFSKIAMVVCLSVWMDRVGWRMKQFVRGALIPAGLIGVIAALLLFEPDFGATMVVGLLGAGILFVTGVRWVHLILLGCAGIPPVAILVALNKNRMDRIWAFFSDSGGDRAAAYHVEQSKIAFKCGGPWGVGFNESIQKYSYLPEAHTDFIFAIGGEELGFVFTSFVVIAFITLLACGILISIRAPDRLGRLLAFGMTLLIIFQAAFNIGVVTGCLPTKGLALPFMSYGGTNLVTALFAIGTLINVGMHIDVSDERIHTHLARDAVNTI
jgi:cell division protein FtsW